MCKRRQCVLPKESHCFSFRRHTNVLRQKVDDATVKMRMLLDGILNRSDEPRTRVSRNSTISVADSDTLLEGLRKLFNASADDEQIRLLTVAPSTWGRHKVENFFDCTEYQARLALEVRQTAGILAYPISCRGNESIDHNTIDQVLDYYRRDGISRPSPNKKDVVLINGVPVGKRFMQMTISQAFESFRMENPSVKIGRSKFFDLRPKNVKPESPHDVCVCIYHENLALLLKVRDSD